MTAGADAMSIRLLAVASIWVAVTGVAEASQPPIRIVVYDQAGVPEATLRKAIETARWMFQLDGVQTHWTACRVSPDLNQHCAAPPEGSYLKAILRPNGAGLQKT